MSICFGIVGVFAYRHVDCDVARFDVVVSPESRLGYNRDTF